jgi:prepilin-type N-terminal cleavage/methylation domain-containing protein
LIILFQRLKNKKGFTLIELIVVIAILGILALIAIPRFAGFTERAREGNDEQYAALVANSVMVIVAAGDVGYTPDSDVTITLSPNGNISTATGITMSTAFKIEDITDLRAMVQGMVSRQPFVSRKYLSTPGGLIVVTNDTGDKTYSVPAAAVANP